MMKKSHCRDISETCFPRKKFDFLLYGSLTSVTVFYVIGGLFSDSVAGISWLALLSNSVFELMNKIWWGLALGFIMVALLVKVPREFVIATLGRGGGMNGLLRATLSGVMLDLCSHGILMVGAKLYERGASIGQVIAFLVASPWNSFSLTLILIALIGIKWTLAFIFFSMIIAIATGFVFDQLTKRGVIPTNRNTIDLPDDFRFWHEAKTGLAEIPYSITFFVEMLRDGIAESRMVVRWIFFGIMLASIIRTFIDTDSFQSYFGPTLAGLGLTIVAATVIEVCSEGSTPIAADLVTRAQAPGNGFAFLMTGVATDYTEIMVLKDTTKSWKIALLLPIVCVPQVIFLAWIMNQFN